MVEKNNIDNYSNAEAVKELARLSILLKRANRSYHQDDDPIMSDAEFDELKKLNKTITPNEILKQRKIFRSSVKIRNIYSEVLHIIQATVMKKISAQKLNIEQKKYLNDALMTSIAGISAAMKNTG